MWPFKPKLETKQTDAELLEMLGGASGATIAVPASVALSVPAVAAAVRTISEAAATLDVHIFEGDQRVDHPIGKLLAGDVNEWTGGYELIRTLVSDALSHDDGGLAWVNRINGEVREVIRYEPGRLMPQASPDGTGEQTYRLNGRPVAASDVIHVRGPMAKCPLSLCREAIGLAVALERYAAGIFRSARPGGVITTSKPVGEAGVAKMMAGWSRAFEGSANAGRTAILYDSATFAPMVLNSTDQQFIENRRFQIEEVARAFNMSPVLLGDLTKSSYANAEQKSKEFLVSTLEPWLRSLEGALARALFTPEERQRYRIQFDRDDLTRADLTTRATAINSFRASEMLSADEGRAWIGLPPRDPTKLDEYRNPNTTVTPANDNNSQNKEPSKDDDAKNSA
ncbi:MAG: phage portal protein [Mesorhizobium sp.]